MKPPLRNTTLVFAAALLILILAEVLRVYWIMPLPGSQEGAILAVITYQTNGPLTADVMFEQPKELRFADAVTSRLGPNTLVVG